MLRLLDLSVLFLDLGALYLRRLQVFGLPRVLLAQEGAKPDQVVLYQDVLLTQFFLADAAPFLLSTVIIKISGQARRQLQLCVTTTTETMQRSEGAYACA